tara:strand:- start:2880 stop:3284 length:405 start_codon:yes stop_codon:yes gene_type:complete
MNKTEYVYLIDPFKKDITLVHLPTGKLELETIYDLVQCATIDMYGLTHDTDLIIDDEGLFVEDQKFFVIEDKVFAGRALIVGAANEDGHSTTPTYPMDFLPVVYTSEYPSVDVSGFTITELKAGESPVDVQLVE